MQDKTANDTMDTMMDLLVLDDRSNGDIRANSGFSWRFVADSVMGGVSSGSLATDVVEGESCLRLTGEVSLENSGGFIQASLDLGTGNFFDASGYAGVLLDVYGNGEVYNVHLRSADTTIVWQSYRCSFLAGPQWQTLLLPFAQFTPHRIGVPLNLTRLKRIGLVAIGRRFAVDLCVKRLALYRD